MGSPLSCSPPLHAIAQPGLGIPLTHGWDHETPWALINYNYTCILYTCIIMYNHVTCIIHTLYLGYPWNVTVFLPRHELGCTCKQQAWKRNKKWRTQDTTWIQVHAYHKTTQEKNTLQIWTCPYLSDSVGVSSGSFCVAPSSNVRQAACSLS